MNATLSGELSRLLRTEIATLASNDFSQLESLWARKLELVSALKTSEQPLDRQELLEIWRLNRWLMQVLEAPATTATTTRDWRG